MIHVDFEENKLCVSCDTQHPYYQRAYLILRSLLTVKSSGYQSKRWFIGYDDFLTLKNKLDNLGLVEGRTMTRAAQEYLSQVQTFDKQNEQLKQGDYNSYIEDLIVGKLKTTPYSDQISGISFITNNWRVGLFDTMGLGKTLQALGAIVALQNEVRKVLVICPKAVIMGFTREIQKHTDLKSIAIPSGKKTALKFLQENIEGDWDVMLVHPENLVQSSKRGRKNEVYGPITKLLKTARWDMIIADEWHQYKNMNAKRTKCVLSLLNEVRDRNNNLCRCILMTGTPISESPANAYVTLRVLSRDPVGHFSRFENYYTITQQRETKSERSYKKIVGYKNLAELKSRIERVSIRRTKDELTGFPDKIFTIRDIELTGRQKDLYKTVCGEVVAHLPATSQINIAEFFTSNAYAIRLRQLLNHPLFINEECASAKYDEIDLILEELFADPEQKVILWTEYRRAVDLIYDRWNAQYGVLKIYGGVEVTDELAHQFEHKDKPRIAACIPAKAGTGVDFLARARTSIYVDRPYSLNLFQQSLDRIHRRVKTKGTLNKLERIRSQPATLMFLDVVNSIDELVRERLQVKQDVSDAIMTSDTKLIDLGRADLLEYLR